MINFRYHIVSLMAVFIALSVGIAVGVSLSPSVDSSLLQQAAQDRKQVSDLRAELDRRNALDDYREAWAQRVGSDYTEGLLAGVRVALVVMPDAPNDVVQAEAAAVKQAGGTVVRQVGVDADVFDPAKADEVTSALEPFAEQLQLTSEMTPATQVGLAIGRSVADKSAQERDGLAADIGTAMTGKGLVTLSRDSTAQAQLVIVVTAVATVPPADPSVLAAHVQLDVALTRRAPVVLAGPNSDGIEGTDVLQARTDSTATDVLSTVDVADLRSGVTTTLLAGKELVLGRPPAHYGALARSDAPAPDLPVR